MYINFTKGRLDILALLIQIFITIMTSDLSDNLKQNVGQLNNILLLLSCVTN